MAEQDGAQVAEEIPQDQVDEGEGTEAEEDQQPEIEYEGEKIPVSAKAKAAWDKWQGDYTRKSMTVAEREKAAEARENGAKETEATIIAFNDEFAAIKALDKQLEPYDKLTTQDWMAWAEQDEKAAGKAQIAVNALRSERQRMAAILGGKINERQSKLKADADARDADATRSIALQVKDWSNEKAAQISDFVEKSYGIPAKDLAPFMKNAGVVRLLSDLHKGSQAAAKALKAAQPNAEPVVVQVPGSPTRTRAPSDPGPKDTDTGDVWRQKFRKQMALAKKRR